MADRLPKAIIRDLVMKAADDATSAVLRTATLAPEDEDLLLVVTGATAGILIGCVEVAYKLTGETRMQILIKMFQAVSDTISENDLKEKLNIKKAEQ